MAVVSPKPTDDGAQRRKPGPAKGSAKPGRTKKAAAVAPPAPAASVRLSDVTRTSVQWLWRPRLPLGKVVMLDGDPSLGKSLLMLDIAARATRGGPWPDGAPMRQPRSVVLMCAEDDLGDTIQPRLEAANADLDRIRAVTVDRDEETGRLRTLTVPHDVPRLREALHETRNPALLIIDPITAYLGERTNSHNDPSVRRALVPLVELAESEHVATVLIRHLNKGGGDTAMYRGGGSIAFIGLARSGLIAARHPNEPDVNVLAHVKSNLAERAQALTYRVLPSDDDGEVPVIEWGEAIHLSPDDLLRKADGRKKAPERDRACAFLLEVLADGPLRVAELEELAEGHNIKFRTVRDAYKYLGGEPDAVRKSTGGVDHWTWALPENLRHMKSWTS